MNTLDSLREGFKLYKDVFVYGVDGNTLLPQETSALQLNRKVFFEQLYEPRLKSDDTLQDFFDSDRNAFWIIGQVGTGKSTLAHHAIMAYAARHQLPEFVIDFKTEQCIAHSFADLSNWISDILEKQANEYCNLHKITETDLASTFFLEGAEGLLSTAAAKIRREIANQYFNHERMLRTSGQTPPSQYNWVNEKALSGDLGDETGQRLADLGRHLNVIDRLIAISIYRSQSTSVKKRKRQVILFDNLDCINDLKTRNHIRDWLKNGAATMFLCAKFLATLRPENEDAYLAGGIQAAVADMPEEAPSFAESSYQIDSMHLTDDFSDVRPEDRKAFLETVKGEFQDEEDKTFEGILPRASERHGMLFETLIYEKRLKFILEQCVALNLHGSVREGVRLINQALVEILNISAIRFDLHHLANRNRRDMLAAMIDFVEYVLDSGKPAWKNIGGVSRVNQKLRFSSIKSIYYRWMVSGGLGARLSPTFDVSAFDPVSWIFDGGWTKVNQNFRLPSDSVSRAVIPQYVSSILDYYVLATIFNMNGGVGGKGWRTHISVKSICNRFEAVGIPGEEIRRRIAKIVRFGSISTHHSFLEISRFSHIANGEDVREEDDVLVTERTCCLLLHTCPMFSYIDELLNRRERRDNQENSASTPALPKSGFDSTLYTSRLVSKTQVMRMFTFIQMGLTHEVRNIEWFTQRHQKTSHQVMEFYAACFSIKPSSSVGTTLLFHRILRTFRAFVISARNLAQDKNDREWLDSFLSKKIDLLDSYLHNHVIKNLQAGRFDLIPRDGPMQVVQFQN